MTSLLARPMLSPASAQVLIDQFSQPELDHSSNASESPASLYSDSSPTFPDQAFEFDHESIGYEVEEREEDEYESIMGSSLGENEWEGSGTGWGQWPESAMNAEPGWSPRSKSTGTSRKGSIISLSPRGSVSTSRRDSIAMRLKSEGDGGRRDSDPSLLGFDLAQRRNSARSLGSQRRRSSVLSNGSVMDPVEDMRLRNIASLDVLRRRYSEVVEVTCPSEEESGGEDLAVARAALRDRVWSDCSDTEDDTDSEIHTAPYFPTPDLQPRQRALLSNYPLASAVTEDSPLQTPLSSDVSPQPSPVAPRRIFRPASLNFISTPPPPAQPIDIMRGRKRPAFPRAATDYQFPARSAGVPEGAAAPRPFFGRSLSNPMFSAPQKAQEPAVILEKRAAGSFPVARSVPLGISPLRASLRRQSIVSDGGKSERRASDSARRASTDSRRGSLAQAMSERSRGHSIDSRRTSIVAERRMSIVNGDRRSSADTRRSSLAKASLSSRKSSTGLDTRRSSSASRRSSTGRRSSLASRKSSVVSIGEYGYLAPQIVIDVAAPPAVAADNSQPSLSVRRNAPRSIAMPAPHFQAVPNTAPNTPCTPLARFNPLESFLGKSPLGLATPTTSTLIGPLTPTSEGSQREQNTPKPSAASIMDRGRPVASPEFVDRFPSKPAGVTSPKAFFSIPHSDSQSSLSDRPPSPRQIIGPKLGVVRKAVPMLSHDELARAIDREVELRLERHEHDSQLAPRNLLRRGAVEQFAHGDSQIPRPIMQPQRRTTSLRGPETRQATLVRRQPVDQQAAIARQFRESEIESSIPAATRGEAHGRATAKDSPRSKQPAVSFSPEPVPVRPTYNRSASSSSFTRFFHGKSKSVSAPIPSIPSPTAKPLKSSLMRPVSVTMEGSSSSSSERTLVEVRDMLRKLGSPKHTSSTESE